MRARGVDRRGMQLLVNAGDRKFVDETRRRIGESAWSLTEAWQQEHRIFDFNGDGTEDIVPQRYDPTGDANVVAWLNDGSGHFVALKTTAFDAFHDDDARASWRFAWGTYVRIGTAFRALEIRGDPPELMANAAEVSVGARITLAKER